MIVLEVFHELKMDETELKKWSTNLPCCKDQTFVICGDRGINDVVANDFWDSTKDAMLAHFKTEISSKDLLMELS
jgi:uncharacterized membrane protein